MSSYQVIYSLAFIAAIVSPGLLMIFIYKRDLFLSLDVIKLLLLALSLSMPILIGTILLSAYDSTGQSFDKLTFYGYFLSLLVAYPPLLFSYLAGFPFPTFVIILIGSYVSLFVVTYFDKKRSITANVGS
ncbi:hypothetical protein VIBRN418_16336 [Vibrio sp. N418]|nr:hypothetical protein VIBRN418_16336 [Vibrio sp. N418]